MIGTKIKTDYLQDEFEIVKIRKLNDRITLIDFKDKYGVVGTANSLIFTLLDGKELFEALKEQKILES